MSVVVDTYLLACSLFKPAFLMLKSGIKLLVPPCSLQEICLTVRIRKRDAMAPYTARMAMNATLMSEDTAFDTFPNLAGWQGRVWDQ